MSARHNVSIIDAMDDPHLFAKFFRDPTTWAAWRAFLCALFGLPMTPEQLVTYKQCTGRDAPPSNGFIEAWLCVGRRGGKSFVLALIACYYGCFRNWLPYLGPGERATIMIIAADRRQARVILRYIKGLLQVPMLRELIEGETQESVDLANRVTIEVHTASFRTTRGYAIAVALVDELAFFSTDENSAEPDREVINALKPGMAQFQNAAMLLCASSPYARKGELWRTYNKFFGKSDAPALVWQAATRTMNPSIPQSVIDAALADDPASAAAEYGAQFRIDIESFVSIEAVNACVSSGVHERAPQRRTYSYVGFVDPSGGSADSMTLCVAHYVHNQEVVVVDALREVKPPFSPEAVVDDFATLLKSYGVAKVVGDKYAGEWPREQFSKLGVIYEASAAPKSDLYRDLLPLINSRRIELLDNNRLVSQLCGLERRTARGGKDSIDHAPGGHDDVANAVAGAAVIATQLGRFNPAYPAFQDGASDDEDPCSGRTWRIQQLAGFLNGMVRP
jgi:hypothetical protein